MTAQTINWNYCVHVKTTEKINRIYASEKRFSFNLLLERLKVLKPSFYFFKLSNFQAQKRHFSSLLFRRSAVVCWVWLYKGLVNQNFLKFPKNSTKVSLTPTWIVSTSEYWSENFWLGFKARCLRFFFWFFFDFRTSTSVCDSFSELAIFSSFDLLDKLHAWLKFSNSTSNE